MKKKILADFQIWISVPLMFMFFYKRKQKLSAVIKFCALGFRLTTHLFQITWQRQLLKNAVVD